MEECLGPPALPRVNTIGIKYIQGACKHEHFEKIIEEILGIKEEWLVGLADHGKRGFLIKLSTDEQYRNVCANFLGRKIPVVPGCVIIVEDLSSYRIRVSTASAAAAATLDASNNDAPPNEIANPSQAVGGRAQEERVATASDIILVGGLPENHSESDGRRSPQPLRGADLSGGTIIIHSDEKIDNEIMEFAKWVYEATGVNGYIQEWNGLKFFTVHPLKDLEHALNSEIKYEKTHELKARCTVFFTRVDKNLLVKIKNYTENKILHKNAEKDSGVTIEDIRHIGLGRTIRVHCRTPTGAETIVKNGLLIGGITLLKGKLEKLNPVVQCTHCWKVDHKHRNCAQSLNKEPPVCGTCGKSGHHRKDCPTPNDPKCILCDGKHSSSAARCLVRQARIKEEIEFEEEYLFATTSDRKDVSQAGSSSESTEQSASVSTLTREGSQIAETDTAAMLAILANATATITSAPPFETEPDATELHAAIAAAFKPVFNSFDIVKVIGDTAWRRARGSREIFLELYKEYLRQNDMPVPKLDSLLEE